MGYIDENLITEESVTHRAYLHWIVLVKPVLIAAAVIAVAAAVSYAIDIGNAVSGQSAFFIWLVVLIVAAVPVIAALIKSRSGEFAVTNKRVILKIGLVQRETAEMFLNKIESVGVDQTLLGRALGYGSIVLRGTGGSLEPFHFIADPLHFRKQIQEQIGESFAPAAKSTSAN